MKKRMFITTIVMMLVLAVALTTSSLAWFSSANAVVTASSATFTAATAGTDNVNLKIGDTVGGWGNSIQLTGSPSARTLSPMVPTAALIPSEATDAAATPYTTTGVTKKGSTGNDIPVEVTHQYTWPARMTFNGAKINASDSKFVIEASGDNAVINYGGNAINSNEGYYYDEFYLLNADQQNTLSTLTFQVSSSISTIASGDQSQEGDYTARGYVAFILFDVVNIPASVPAHDEVPEVVNRVPANALENAGLKVVAFDTDNVDSTSEVKETASGKGLDVWIPFVGFTFCTDKEENDTFQEAAWQFADLDQQTTPGTYDYNGALTTSLKTQNYDALTGTGNSDGFVLNTASLKNLNNKVINDSGNVDNSRSVQDTTSVFVMQPGEIWRVAMYYWLDGQTLTEFTDTTVSTIGVTISAAR